YQAGNALVHGKNDKMSNYNPNAYVYIPSKSPYPATNATHSYPSSPFQQGSSTMQATPSYLGGGRKAWDSPADNMALTAHCKGKTTTEISGELIKSGYRASLHDVATNLNRLGVTSLNGGGFTNRKWDAQANEIAMDAHLIGRTVSQIAGLLNSAGYSITKAEVGLTLSMHGVKKVEWAPGVPSRLSWDNKADTVALAGHRAGKSAAEISGEICRRGYNVSPEEVAASVQRQVEM
ncbi:hypothetical protein MMC31_002140, partial [Peltigera leucophlebia]|nr:hypothetical protein [Peltigera leucophlebia]